MRNLLIITNNFPSKDNKFYGNIFVKREIRKIRTGFYRITVISPLPLFVKRNLKDYNFLNINVYFPRFFHAPLTPFRKVLGYRQYLIANRLIKRKKINFSIIHGHFIWPSGFVSMRLSEEYNVPFIVTVHGGDIRDPLTNCNKQVKWNQFLKKKVDEVVTKANVIISPHEELRDLLIKEYGKSVKHKIKLVYKGINLNKFSMNEEVMTKVNKIKKDLQLNNKFIVLFLARFDWDKDPLTFVKAAELLKKERDIYFIMVGGGKYTKKINRIINQKRIRNIKIIGPRNDPEVWYALADVFCAISPQENIWSTTLQEALSMGKACIVTNSGYTTKILKHGKDAYIIKRKNANDLKEAILKLKADSNLKRKLEQRGYSFWRKKFDDKKTSRKLLKIYRELKNR